jgi:DNA-binding protein H-NS
LQILEDVSSKVKSLEEALKIKMVEVNQKSQETNVLIDKVEEKVQLLKNNNKLLTKKKLKSTRLQERQEN